MKKKDPSRPVYLNLGQGMAWPNWIGRGECFGDNDSYKISNNGYLKGCDIASFEIYPVNNYDEETGGNLWYVSGYTAASAEAGLLPGTGSGR
jgi:hypothetical protein